MRERSATASTRLIVLSLSGREAAKAETAFTSLKAPAEGYRLQERRDVAAFCLQRRLRLRQDITREVREPVRALHALAGVSSLCMERDRLSVFAEHGVEVLLGLLEGGIAWIHVAQSIRGGEGLGGDLLGGDLAGPELDREIVEGGDVQVRGLDELPVGGDAGMRERFPVTTATSGRRREDERCRSEANPPQLPPNDRAAPEPVQSPIRGWKNHPKISERYVIVRCIPTES